MFKRKFKKFLAVFILVTLFISQTVFAEDLSASDKDFEYLKSVMEMVKEKYKGEVTEKQLMEGALKGIFGSMDPYTTYFTNEEADSFLSDIGGIYSGIGVMMEKVGDYAVITKVFSSSPAERAGILPGDKIAAVDDKSVVGASLEEISKLVKGEAGTNVKIGIMREGKTGLVSIQATRSTIVYNPVSYDIKNDIGCIRLETFNANTDTYITKALDEMDKKSIKKIILDLRNNPGGEVSQAVAVARKFVPQGLITKLDFKSEEYTDEEYYSYLKATKYKLVVLVNRNSASASEIVAGAIQDTGAGTLIGSKTFGKAKVQTLIPILTPEAFKKYEEKLNAKLVDSYELMSKYGITPGDNEIMGWTKITTGEYTTPKGRMIDKIGLSPDIKVEDYKLVKDVDINNIQKLSMSSKPGLNSESIDAYNAEKILMISGYDVDTPDTKLDIKTFEAIKKFQKDNKLWPNGVLDFGTQKLFNEKLEKQLLQIDKQFAKAVELLNSK